MKVKLGDIFEIGSGGTPSKAHPEYYGGEIPWVKTGDLKSKYLYEAEDFITNDGLKNSSAKMYEPDTVLIAMYGATIGATSILKMFACTNQACAAFRKNDKVIPEFLYYFLKSRKERFIKDGVGGAQPNISAGYLKKVEIELPPLEEQQVIVNILDKASSIILGKKYEIQLLDELVKARFVEMFGDVSIGDYRYETRKLGDVANIGSSHRVFTTEFVESGIPFYRGKEIAELAKGTKPTNLYYISVEHYNRLTNDDTKPQIGDLLMPSICNKGQVWMVDTTEPFYYKDGRVLCISPDRNIFNTKYLEYFMKAKTLVEYPKLGSGSTFAEFKIFLLKDIDILIPPRNIQDEFADFVHQIDKSKVAIKKSLDETQILFDSLMQKYFG